MDVGENKLGIGRDDPFVGAGVAWKGAIVEGRVQMIVVVAVVVVEVAVVVTVVAVVVAVIVVVDVDPLVAVVVVVVDEADETKVEVS